MNIKYILKHYSFILTLVFVVSTTAMLVGCSSNEPDQELIKSGGEDPDEPVEPEVPPLDGEIIAYPAVPGLETSSDFTVIANGIEIWTEKLETPLPSPPYKTGEESFVNRVNSYLGTQKVAYTRFSTTGGVRIQVKVNKNVSNCTIRPKNRNIVVDGIGTKTLTFDIKGPEKLYVEIDDLPELLIFADAPENESEIPNPDDPNVYYYEAGKIHNVGKLQITESGKTVYIEDGAVLAGWIEVRNATGGTKIKGRGILDATVMDGDGNCIYTHFCNNIDIQDIVIRNQSRGWMCYINQSTNIRFKNVKITGFGANNDGIDFQGSRSCSVDDSFIRTTDDCIAIKTTGGGTAELNNHIKNSTMYGVASSDGITLGFETKGPCRKVTVMNCDIIGGRGSSTVGGHSAFSMICDGAGPMEDIRFENIRVEDKVYDRNFDIIVTDGTHYVTGTTPGSISGVVIKNVHWEKNTLPMHILGYNADHKVCDVLFDGCTVAGIPLTDASVGKITINEFTEGIRFR